MNPTDEQTRCGTAYIRLLSTIINRLDKEAKKDIFTTLGKKEVLGVLEIIAPQCFEIVKTALSLDKTGFLTQQLKAAKERMQTMVGDKGGPENQPNDTGL